MAKITTFKDLLVWQKAHNLTLSIYRETNNYPREELFGLTSQMRRAAVSVSANIVEGFRRYSIKDSIHFYVIADASLEELKYHLLLSRDLKYITLEIYTIILKQAEEVGKMLTTWVQTQRSFIK